MTDYIDDVVDAQTVLDDEDLHNSTNSMDDEDKQLLAEGVMTRDEAKALTEAIKASAVTMYAFVKRAHDGKIWKSMGYTTWTDYVTHELDMSTGRSYQLINQAKVTEELEAAAPDGTRVTITEAQARAIKSELPRITDRVKTETVDDQPAVAAKKINDIVKDERERIKNDSATVNEPEDDGNDEEDDVQEDSFQDLDRKGSAPKPDRLNAGGSGSTADDPIDLDGPVDDDVNDMMDDVVDDDAISDEMNFNYLFSYFGSLRKKRPYEVAKTFSGDIQKTKDSIDEMIKWMQEFESKLG